MCLSWKIRAACDCQILACEDILPALIVGAAAEAANQVSYGEGHRGSRVRALLDGCTQEVVGLAGAFADGFRGVGRRLLRLSVDILQCTLVVPENSIRAVGTMRENRRIIHYDAGPAPPVRNSCRKPAQVATSA